MTRLSSSDCSWTPKTGAQKKRCTQFWTLCWNRTFSLPKSWQKWWLTGFVGKKPLTHVLFCKLCNLSFGSIDLIGCYKCHRRLGRKESTLWVKERACADTTFPVMLCFVWQNIFCLSPSGMGSTLRWGRGWHQSKLFTLFRSERRIRFQSALSDRRLTKTHVVPDLFWIAALSALFVQNYKTVKRFTVSGGGGVSEQFGVGMCCWNLWWVTTTIYLDRYFLLTQT